MTEEVDLDELKEKAKVLSEATGRSEADVLADLLDDGILNQSNKPGSSDGDLISELKRAAELIGTVQQVNKQVSENSVLNGGQNKTDVKIETTLEGDVVDRAIESAQRKADAIRKLATTIVPIMLLLGGGGTLDAMGVIDIFGSDDSDPDENWNIEVDIHGCTDPEAENYDQYANWDDGSCWYDDDDDGCGAVYSYSDPYLRFRDGSEHNLEVVWELEHDKTGDDCVVEIEFMLSLYYEGGYEGSAEYHELPRSNIPSHPVERILQHDMLTDLGDGNWSVEARWKYANGNEDGCCIMTNDVQVGQEDPDDNDDGDDDRPCEPFFYSVDAIREIDAYNNTIIIGSFDVDFDGSDCGDYEAEIKVEMEPHTCDENREWIHYDDLTYLTKGQDGDIEEIEWNMTASESHWSCVDVLFRITIEPNDYEVRWVEDI
jgi:hypothetical protein